MEEDVAFDPVNIGLLGALVAKRVMRTVGLQPFNPSYVNNR